MLIVRIEKSFMKKKIFFGVCIQLITSLVLSILSWYWNFISWYIALVIFITIIVTNLLVVYTKSFRRIGLLSSYKKRGESIKFKEALSNAECTVDFLVSWGGSLPGMSSYWQREVSEMVNRGIKFRFLILKPNSYGELERRSRRSMWTTDDHLSVLNALIGIKKDRIETGHWDDFRVSLYDSEACWSMAFVDAKQASIGFYGRGVGRDHPSLELIRTKEQGLFDFYLKTYEDLWNIASAKYAIHTAYDLVQLIEDDNNRINQGLIFVLTGPCGSGKTSITNVLINKHNNLKQLSTFTTRPQREKSETKSQYVFITDDEYMQNNQMNYTLKANYCCFKYAISIDEINTWKNSNNDYIMDSIFDPDDMRRVFKERMVLIYLTASTYQKMIDRVRNRFNNERSQLLLRAEHARTISANATLCDYIIYTDESIETIIKKIEDIIKYSRQNYNNTGVVISENDSVKEYRAVNQIDIYGLPNDDVLF